LLSSCASTSRRRGSSTSTRSTRPSAITFLLRSPAEGVPTAHAGGMHRRGEDGLCSSSAARLRLARAPRRPSASRSLLGITIRASASTLVPHGSRIVLAVVRRMRSSASFIALAWCPRQDSNLRHTVEEWFVSNTGIYGLMCCWVLVVRSRCCSHSQWLRASL
jgi:hypothetical protein